MNTLIPKRAGMDVEGPWVNPGADFAWGTYPLLSESTKRKFPRVKCENYDGRYDDGRYFYELGRSCRHSTGMWPPLSLALAAFDGKTDDDLIAFAEKTTQLNPGTDKLIEYLLENFDGKVYPITSSYPAVALSIAKKYEIPFNQVFTNGFQPEKEESKRDFVEEVKRRSPISVLSSNKKELGRFLTQYQKTCEVFGDYYNLALKENVNTDELIRTLLVSHRGLFENVRDNKLRNALEYLFLTEKGVMGSHRKVDEMRSVHDDRRAWTYGGDSIVDGMPIEYADFGFSINMKDRHALPFSKMNFATTDMSKMIPVFDNMLNGRFGLKLKEELDSEELRVFTPRDIQRDIETVIKVNGEMKNKLKAMYVPVKI